VPVTVACDIVALALPVLLITIDFAADPPITTFPKFQDVGFKTINAEGGAVPAPLKDRLAGELGASLATETLPFALPVVEGAKFTVIEVVAPAASARGKVIPVTL
jgi:hypothetical protein